MQAIPCLSRQTRVGVWKWTIQAPRNFSFCVCVLVSFKKHRSIQQAPDTSQILLLLPWQQKTQTITKNCLVFLIIVLVSSSLCWCLFSAMRSCFFSFAFFTARSLRWTQPQAKFLLRKSDNFSLIFDHGSTYNHVYGPQWGTWEMFLLISERN